MCMPSTHLQQGRTCVIVTTLLVASVTSLDNGLALVPAMGWSSWNHYGGSVNEKILLAAADAFVSSGLKDAGYEYINLDDGWAASRNASGFLVADKTKFPRGIEFVASYIHSKGLKFGIYTARGSKTCMGRPGSDSHEQQDAELWASWGVDYLKEDSCGGTTHGTVWEQYSIMRDALNKTGRPIYFSITQGLPYTDNFPKMHCYGSDLFTTKIWMKEGFDPTTLANSYLVEYCNNMDFFGFTAGVPKPGGFLSNLDSQQLLTFDNLTVSGAMNDNDMLEVCNGGQSVAEYRAQFATWSILSSPLILGNDITTMDDDCKTIVLNTEVIGLNQDSLVSRGKLVHQWPDAVWPNKTTTNPHRHTNTNNNSSNSNNNTTTTTNNNTTTPTSTIENSVPSPTIVMSVGLEQCLSNRSKQQTFVYNEKNGTINLVGTTLCLDYGGYSESNFGLAECNGWSQGGIGGQTWDFTNGSFWNRNNGEKCVDVFNCDLKANAQVCTCTNGGASDCFAATKTSATSKQSLSKTYTTTYTKTSAKASSKMSTEASSKASPKAASNATPKASCDQKNLLWHAPGFPTSSSVISTAVDDYTSCLTATPLPSSGVNITLQVWAKPLRDGSIGVVVFNRGDVAIDVVVQWAWLGLAPTSRRRVRNLWEHEDVGNFTSSFACNVDVHDASAFRLFPL